MIIIFQMEYYYFNINDRRFVFFELLLMKCLFIVAVNFGDGGSEFPLWIELKLG